MSQVVGGLVDPIIGTDISGQKAAKKAQEDALNAQIEASNNQLAANQLYTDKQIQMLTDQSNKSLALQQQAFDYLALSYPHLHHFDLEFYSQFLVEVHEGLSGQTCYESIESYVRCFVSLPTCQDFAADTWHRDRSLVWDALAVRCVAVTVQMFGQRLALLKSLAE